jgi:triosephosphate isomerase (TIM)
MRRKLIAGNWKMYKTVPEAVALVEEIKKGAAGAPSDILVAPPYTSLVAASRRPRAARSRSPPRTCTSRRKGPSPARSRRRC